MSDFSDPKAPKSSRKKGARNPATIDLKATVVDDGSAKEEVRPEEPVVTEPEKTETEAAAAPSASVDSGLGSDAIGPGPDSQEGSVPDAAPEVPPAQEAPPQEPPSFQESPRNLPPEAPPARQGHFGAIAGAGLVGGLIGAGLVYGLQAWQGPAAPNDQRLVQLEERVAALSRQPATPAGPQGNVQELEQRIGALEEARGSIDQRFQEIRGIAEQAASQAQEALNRPPPPPAPQPQQDSTALNELGSRLTALEEQVRTRVEGAQQSAADAVQALQTRLAELDSRVAAGESRAAEQESRMQEQLQQQVQRLETLAAQAAQGNDEAAEAGIRVILSERLADALRNGTPYADVLEALKKVEADPGRLSPLEPFAEQGAPTAAELAQSFAPLSATILRDERAASGSWTDRLVRMAERVVTIRPVNEPDTPGVPGLVARIERALERGDVGEAAAAWEALPEPARRMSEEWGRQARARAEADKAAQAVAADALSALNRTTQ